MIAPRPRTWSASCASFRSLFVSDSSPFYESARLLEVQPIPADDFARYLQKTFEKGAFKISRELIDALLATALHEDLGYATQAFLSIAGAAHRSTIAKALKPTLEGRDPLVEKVGSHFRIRNRFLRRWLRTRKLLVQELVPALREEALYRASITRVCPQLPFD